MAGDWTQVRLRDICEKITKGTTPTTIGYSFSDSGINFIKSECLTYEGKIDSSKFAYIGPETHQAMSRSQIQTNDILMSMAGVYLGKVGIISVEHTPANTNQAVAIIRLRPKGVSHRFVTYCLRAPLLLAHIRNGVAQSAQPNINLADIGNLKINLPGPKEQQAIARILGSLDDKIELNRKMNETLEQMAKAIFKSWFIDFDPVKAKAEGCKLNPPKEISGLFPDSFQESELGDIPMGWEVRGLDEIAEYLNGLALQKYPPGETASLPVIKIAQLRTGNTEDSDRASVDIPPEYVVGDGDVLFSWSGSLEVIVWCGGPGALNQHLFRVTSDHFPKWFYYQWTKHHLPSFQDIAADKATTMGHIQRYHLREAKVLIPSQKLMVVMDRQMAPLLEKMIANRIEVRSLASLRDSLLPKLLSGAIRIKDAERFV